MERKIQQCADVIEEAEAVLIGAGAGLSAAAGINYTDKKIFVELFPAWVKKGFTMQYELMGYTGWSQAEQWGYFTVHLGYVYFGQQKNRLYHTLKGLIDQKDYFVMTSNVDDMFHKNGFATDRIYAPQGSYGRLQCTTPCSDALWDTKPFYEKMKDGFDPVEQVIKDPESIPVCPKCGGTMFIHARADNSFIETVQRKERTRLIQWLNGLGAKKVVLLELGAGYNTPVVIRFPMEELAMNLPNVSYIRVNLDYSGIPGEIKGQKFSFKEDIAAFIKNIADLQR